MAYGLASLPVAVGFVLYDTRAPRTSEPPDSSLQAIGREIREIIDCEWMASPPGCSALAS
jgi:hypothetical protein